MVTVKTLPWPSSLRTAISPPSACANRRLMVRPRPVPPNCRVTELSACTNGSKIDSSFSAGMPMPLSITAMLSCGTGPDDTSPATTLTPPSWVNLMALPTRLVIVCRSRAGSERIVSGMAPSTSKSNEMVFSRAFTPSIWRTSRIMACGAQRMHSTSRCPASTLDRSRTSLIKLSRCLPLEWMVLRCFFQSRSSWLYPRLRISVKPRIAFIGVRISWLMLARNSLLARFASSASSLD